MLGRGATVPGQRFQRFQLAHRQVFARRPIAWIGRDAAFDEAGQTAQHRVALGWRHRIARQVRAGQDVRSQRRRAGIRFRIFEIRRESVVVEVAGQKVLHLFPTRLVTGGKRDRKLLLQTEMGIARHPVEHAVTRTPQSRLEIHVDTAPICQRIGRSLNRYRQRPRQVLQRRRLYPHRHGGQYFLLHLECIACACNFTVLRFCARLGPPHQLAGFGRHIDGPGNFAPFASGQFHRLNRQGGEWNRLIVAGIGDAAD